MLAAEMQHSGMETGLRLQGGHMKGLMLWLLTQAFGCHHECMSWPITLGERTYQVCCDCGAEFDYSWETMSFKRHPEMSKPADACSGALLVGQL
jgi:hypothetical protein